MTKFKMMHQEVFLPRAQEFKQPTFLINEILPVNSPYQTGGRERDLRDGKKKFESYWGRESLKFIVDDKKYASLFGAADC